MQMLYVPTFVLIIAFYIFIIALLFLIVTRLYRRSYKLFYQLSNIIDEMIYMHAWYLYNLRQSWFNVAMIDQRFVLKTKRIQQPLHQTIDYILLYKILKTIHWDIYSNTHTVLFEKSYLDIWDRIVNSFETYYHAYTKTKRFFTWITFWLYKLIDINTL